MKVPTRSIPFFVSSLIVSRDSHKTCVLENDQSWYPDTWLLLRGIVRRPASQYDPVTE